MTTYYKATFSNGSIQTRSTSAGRTYTHAWLVQWKDTRWDNQEEYTGESAGFSGSEQLARKQLSSWTRKLTFYGIAPTVEITRREYRALKAVS